VDHIIPTAKNGSNTLFNKVLAHGSCNNKKSDKTPQQAIEARIFSKEVIDSLVEKLQKQRDLDKDHKRCAKKKNKECSCYFGKKIARLKLQGAVADTDMEAMERAFNETSYIGKYLNEWLNPLTNSKEEKEVHNKNVTTGKITAFLRRHMGVDDLLEEIRINEHKPLINKDGVFFSKALKDEIKAEKDAIYVNNRGMDYYQKEGHFLHVLKEKAEHRGLKKWADFIFYKRIDHRHHLIDAAMIAITSRGLINAAQRFYSKVGSLDGKYVEEYDKVNGEVTKSYVFEDRFWRDVLNTGQFAENSKEFLEFKEHFRNQLKEKLTNYVVWHKPDRFVNKEFVNEGVYSLKAGFKKHKQRAEIYEQIKNNNKEKADLPLTLITRVDLGKLVDSDYAKTLKNLEKKIVGGDIKKEIIRQFEENYYKIKDDDLAKLKIDRALKEDDLIRTALCGWKNPETKEIEKYGVRFPVKTKNIVKKVRVYYIEGGNIEYRDGKDLYKVNNNAVQISAGYNCAKISSTNVEILTNLAYTKYSEERKNKKLGFEKGVRFLFPQDIIYYEPKGVEKGKGKFYLVCSFIDKKSAKNKVCVKLITETNSFGNLESIQGGIKKLLDKSDIKDREKKELEAIIENQLYKSINLDKEKNFIRICYKKEHIEDCKINGLGAKHYKS
jgi:hypothetical protein